jgi:pimeloyl-ACP methyl ester carboxylesterase
MSGLTVALMGVLAALLAGLGWAWWMVRRRPTAVFIWGCRRALKACGLMPVTVPSPVGPQHVFVGGSGPVLVLLHGAGDQAGTWARVAPALVKDHTLVVPDLAGHGRSAPASGPIDFSAVVAGLEAVLESQLRGRRAALVGNSMGGWMATLLAARHPEWTERVVPVNGGPLKGLAHTVNLLPRTRAEALKTMTQLRDPDHPPIPVAVLDDLVRRSRGGALARLTEAAAGMEAWNMDEAQLAALRAPFRLLWGTADQLLPMDYARRMAAALPDARLIPIERCGHIPQQEAPGRFLEALAEALN